MIKIIDVKEIWELLTERQRQEIKSPDKIKQVIYCDELPAVVIDNKNKDYLIDHKSL